MLDSVYYKKVIGCWLGKAVGGTLGVPFEGQDGPLDIEFYTPVPTEMLPNDDLDLQVVWACVIDKLDPVVVDRHILAKAWRDHVEFPWDEYGVALRNMANGLTPPQTGSHDNWFAHGMGATIRSEIWACLAPGNPALAAAYAYEDACVDHEGVGVQGEMFFAALESAAFEDSDTNRLLNGAVATLPTDSLVRRAVEDTRVWWDEQHDWLKVRELILRDYGHENFTDTTMNVAFTVLGWLAGEGDFSRSICIANNCGKDTDCTAATVGALMGIIDPDCIDEKWLAPIGRDLVLSPGIVNLPAPSSLDGFTDLVLSLRKRLDGRAPEATSETQSTEHLQVQADIAFLNEMPAPETVPELPANACAVIFGGTYGTWPQDDFKGEYMLLHYKFNVEEDRPALVMLNTPGHCRVWCDGKFLFERESGLMAPSFHRVPAHQQARVELSAGEHSIIAVIQRPQDGREAQWVVGVGDVNDKQWLPKAFLSTQASA